MKVIKVLDLVNTPVAEGVSGGNWMFRVKNGAGDDVHGPVFSTVPETPWPMSLPAGTYTVQSQRLAANNNALGLLGESVFEWDGVGQLTVQTVGSVGVVDV